MRVAVITDTHLAPGADSLNANWRAAQQFVASANVDLTVHLGDSTIDGADDPAQFDWVGRMIRQWPSPMHVLPGNHDVGDNDPGTGKTVDQPITDQRLAVFRGAIGQDYWSVDAGKWRLVGLNAQLLGSGLSAETQQWDWLFDVAGGSAAKPTVLLLHKPLCRDDMKEAVPSDNYVTPPARQRLQQAMAMMDLRAVLSGHRHQYLDQLVDGLRHIWVPSTAFILPDRMQERIGEKFNGLGVLDLGGDDLDFHLVCPQGMRRNDALDPRIFREVQDATVQPLGR